jgi:YesN/AraC family two-component response regulator
MIKATSETVDLGEDSFVQELNTINKLLECKSVQGMKEQMIHILKGISDYIVRNKKSHNSNLKDELREFIEQNYSNQDLSITVIADKFGMHPVYISSFCKEQTGMSLLDYINKIRVSKAKQLLKEQKLNISEAALQVGYSDTRSLIRMFKKYEGITPGQYKKSNE